MYLYFKILKNIYIFTIRYRQLKGRINMNSKKKDNKSKRPQYHIAFYPRNNDIAIFCGIDNYRRGTSNYSRTHSGRVSHSREFSLPQCIDDVEEIICNQFNPKLPRTELPKISIKEGEFINITSITSSIPPFYIDPIYINDLI